MTQVQTVSPDIATTQAAPAGEQAVTQWVVPSADVLQREGDLRLLLDVPGVRREDLTVGVQDGVLEIAAPRSDRPQRGYRRRFQLADRVDPAGIEATLAHGVLTLTLPARAEARPRTIEVKVA